MVDIIVFGDSIVYGAWDSKGGWVARLREWIDAQNHATGKYSMVYNLGIPGDTVLDVHERMLGELRARMENPSDALVLIAVGTNDSYVRAGKERVSIEVYRTQLSACIQELLKEGVKPVLVGLVGCDESKTNPVSWGSHRYLNARLEIYNSVAKEVATAQHVDFIDLWPQCSGLSWNASLDDGIHPNSKGHENIFGIVKDSVEKFLRK